MSEKMTRIRLRGSSNGNGRLEWGEKTFQEMLESIRRSAQYERAKAQEILDAKPEDFEVALVRGPYVQHFIREVKP